MKANAILLGAPKCGSTTIYESLRAHPECTVSKSQEARYFMDPTYPLFRSGLNSVDCGVEGYDRCFPHNPGSKIVFDATPDYLYQTEALKKIPKLDTEPLLLVCLRRPLARMYSLFNYARGPMLAIDSQWRFSEFVDELLYSGGKPFRDRPILRAAISHSKYENWLPQWLSVVPKERLEVWVFEEFINCPTYYINSLLERYGAELLGPTRAPPRANETRMPRARGVHAALRKIGGSLSRFSVYAPLKSLYLRVACAEVPHSEFDLTAKQTYELDKLFRPTKEYCEELLGREISAW